MLDAPFRVERCDNGATLLFVDTPAEIVHIEAFVDVGKDDQAPEDLEMAHYVEHLNAAFTSAAYPDAAANRRRKDEAGAQSNAYTSSKLCGYHLTAHVDTAASLVDMVLHSIADFAVDERILEEEASAVRQELRDRYVNNKWHPFEVAWAERLYGAHPRNAHPQARIDNVPRLAADPARLVAWRRKHYCPPCLVVALVGPHGWEGWAALEAQTRAQIAAIEARPPALARTRRVPRPSGVLSVRVPHVTSAKVRVAFACPWTRADLGATLCLLIMRRVLTSGLSSRLYRQLRYEHGGLVYSVHSYPMVDEDEQDLSWFVVETNCEPDEGSVRTVVEAIFTEALYPPTDEECDKVRRMIRRERETARTSSHPSRFADDYGGHVRLFGGAFRNDTLVDEQLRILDGHRDMFAALCALWSQKGMQVCLCGTPASPEAEDAPTPGS